MPALSLLDLLLPSAFQSYLSEAFQIELSESSDALCLLRLSALSLSVENWGKG